MQTKLSRRERQIMDVLFEKGHATVHEVLEALPDPPGYSAVRAMLRILEDKGHVTHEQDGPRYVFAPVAERGDAAINALEQVVRTFFGGNPAIAAATLLSGNEMKVSPDEAERLAVLIDKARRNGQ